LILRFPGRLRTGVRRPEPVRLVDVMPTVLELLGVGAPPYLQGRSLVALLGDDAGAVAASIASDYSSSRTQRVYRSFRANGLTSTVAGGRGRLSAPASDPGERRDASGERPAALASMRDGLHAWADACAPLAARFAPHGPGVMPPAETVRQLRALGYVQ